MDEVKMRFDSEVAKDVGTDSAIILSNIEYWCNLNKSKGINFHDGYYWTYNTIKAFKEQFDWLSESQIRRCLKKLEKSEYIKVGNYNKIGFDQTKWYCSNRQIDVTKSSNGSDETVKPIPNNKPNKKTYSSSDGINTNIDWDVFLDFFNEKTGKEGRSKFKTINDKAKRGFLKILKAGYDKKDIARAIINCKNNDYHKENPHHLTPEFISRMDKFEKYFNVQQKKLVLPDNYREYKLNPKQRQLLSPEKLKSYDKHVIKCEIEGYYFKPCPEIFEEQ